MRTKKRLIFVCNYCKYNWFSNKKPKVCPRCHNPVGKRPKYYTSRVYAGVSR